MPYFQLTLGSNHPVQLAMRLARPIKPKDVISGTLQNHRLTFAGHSIKWEAAVATVDANDEYEQAEGWLNCIEEVFSSVKTARVLDQEVVLKGFDIEDGITIVAICKLGKKSSRVTLESVEWNYLSATQKLWLKAWRDWRPK